MSFDLQKHNVAVHASRLSPEFKKAIHSESGIAHLKRGRTLRQVNESSSFHVNSLSLKEDAQLISDSRIYALKKRLLAPSWWVEGILLSLGSKEAWFDALVSKRVGKIVAVPPQINAKNITLMFAIWHEALSKIFMSKSDELFLRFQINKYLIGTQKDVFEICKQLESIWATPLNLFEIRPSKKSKSFSLFKAGSLSCIRHAQVENDVDGVWLSLSLSQSLKTFYCPQEIQADQTLLKPSFVSINPVVIQSMGSKASVKKILNYLFLEFSKQESIEHQVNNWSSIPIDSKNISTFHKDLLLNVPSLYDHGVLGWSIAAPNVKLSELKQKISEKSDNPFNTSPGSIVYCWQLSEQAKEASELEQALGEKLMAITPSSFAYHPVSIVAAANKVTTKISQSGTLFPEPPPDQLKKARTEKAKKAEKIEKKFEKKGIVNQEASVLKKAVKKVTPNTLFDNSSEPILKKVTAQTLFDNVDSFTKSSSVTTKRVVVKRKVTSVKDILSDDDFIILVSEFYESLKPLQKKAFERERSGMTPEQFRVYMTPILQRKSSKIQKR